METKRKIWSCKIGEVAESVLFDGADGPMRDAVEAAYRHLTGEHNTFCFSGWGAELDESERAVVENREPNAEHYENWKTTIDKAAALWALLDDIDTLDDMAKGDDAAFRELARTIQQKRFRIMSGEDWEQTPFAQARKAAYAAPSTLSPHASTPER